MEVERKARGTVARRRLGAPGTGEKTRWTISAGPAGGSGMGLMRWRVALSGSPSGSSCGGGGASSSGGSSQRRVEEGAGEGVVVRWSEGGRRRERESARSVVKWGWRSVMVADELMVEVLWVCVGESGEG